jgi:catechol 2,3-dioxygenase-like lactoylglutathione lyase family enzyme
VDDVMSDIDSNFNVGGVMLPRPFHITRLGHFGLNFEDIGGAVEFYTKLIGLRLSDTLDFAKVGDALKGHNDLGDTNAYFTRYGTDHHAFVLMPRKVRRALDSDNLTPKDITINQLAWQVGTMAQVANALAWLKQLDFKIYRTGRDVPGSNWHVYNYDPDHLVNELYYGIEQIGWSGHSKPFSMQKHFFQPPDLPHISEQQEVDDANAAKIDLLSGSRNTDALPAKFDVDGILMPRPFKITQNGPVHLFVEDIDLALNFYTNILGLPLTETIEWQGHSCHFLRSNTEHHSLGLYPKELRSELGLSGHTSCLSCGFRVHDFQQLRNAIDFLKGEGVEIKKLPPELFPGMGHTAFAIDPEGHAIQLYHYMEQIGWDGKPCPPDQRPQIDNDNWPTSVEMAPNMFGGEIFLGPWA